MNSIKFIRSKRYFEGWYFKHKKGRFVIAVIPGFHITNNKKYAFIQVITNDNSYYIPYSIRNCYINRRRLWIKIGNNYFSKKGMSLNIKNKNINLKGDVRYSNLDPIKYTIMGAFRYLPFMECKHEIISMYHNVNGCLYLNGKEIVFDQKNQAVNGYIEKDWGCSFPKSYLWIQWGNNNTSIVVSVAEIPYMGLTFKGCICVIHHQGKEYRMATYLGVKIIQSNKNHIILAQGKNILRVDICDKVNHISHSLLAPKEGDMSKTIYEKHFCHARFQFLKGKQKIFDISTDSASFEFV